MRSPEGFSQENIEKYKFHFSYANNEMPGHPVIFECDADNIFAADILFEQTIGKKPEKDSYIACSIVNN